MKRLQTIAAAVSAALAVFHVERVIAAERATDFVPREMSILAEYDPIIAAFWALAAGGVLVLLILAGLLMSGRNGSAKRETLDQIRERAERLAESQARMRAALEEDGKYLTR